MIKKDSLKTVLLEGRRLNSQKYRDHCGEHHVKTFYFFCERLGKEPVGTALSSTDLENYILKQLAERHIPASAAKFNPQGWFGKAWTEWKDINKNQTLFKSEYLETLDRLDDAPYSYRLKPECYEMVKEVFREFQQPVVKN